MKANISNVVSLRNVSKGIFTKDQEDLSNTDNNCSYAAEYLKLYKKILRY